MAEIPKIKVKRVEKPWGHEIIYAHNKNYAGKILFVRQGEALSLQYHEKKDETLYIQQGSVEFVTLDEKTGDPLTIVLKEGDAVHIKPKMRHRISGLRDSTILEVSSPFLDDVVRLEDRYGRTKEG